MRLNQAQRDATGPQPEKEDEATEDENEEGGDAAILAQIRAIRREATALTPILTPTPNPNLNTNPT